MTGVKITAKPNLAAETEKKQIASAQKTIDANQAAIDALKEEQAKVNDTISGLKDRKADTASYIKTLDQSMTELTNEVNELNASIAQKQLERVCDDEAVHHEHESAARGGAGAACHDAGVRECEAAECGDSARAEESGAHSL